METNSLNLRRQAAALVERSGHFADNAKAENRNPSLEEIERGKADLAEANRLDIEAQFLEDQQRTINHLHDDVTPQISGLNSPVSMPDWLRVQPADFTPPASKSRPGNFGKLFGKSGLSTGGFRSFEEFLRTVHGGLGDPRLMQAAMTGTSGSSGGFLVPEQYAAAMLDKSLEAEIVRGRADTYAMISDSLRIAGFDSEDNSGSALFGGFTGEWLAEGATATEADAKVRSIVLNASKLAIFTSASNELVADGLSFERMLGDTLIRAIGWHLDYSFLRGTGAGQPKGVLNDGALVTVAKENLQAADTLVAENIVAMWSRLHPACAANAVWVCNPTVLPQLFLMTIGVGTSGLPAFMPTGGLSGAPFQTLMGRPLLVTEKLPVLGDKGDLILCDFSQYAVGMRAEIVLERSLDAGWSTDVCKYRVKLRADGMGKWSKAFTPKNGSTLSWAVCLAAR